MKKNRLIKAALSTALGGAVVFGMQACAPQPTTDTSAAAGASQDGSHDGHDHSQTAMNHDAASNSSGSPSSQLHAVMMRPMENMNVTGDIDTDFAALMIPHHQGAIDMAKIQLEHGKNEDLKKMARSIMGSQAEEIEVLKKFAGEDHPGHSHAAGSDSPSAKLHEVMMRPMADMKTTGDVDRDFAALMIPHHQGAIDMAKIEIEHGKKDELKTMARSIVDSQAKEIEALKKHAGK